RCRRGPVPEGRPKSLSVPKIFVVEAESRHEQATARRIVECSCRFRNAGISVKGILASNQSAIGSTVPLGRGYFPDDSRHFVPGYDHAVPPGQNTFSGLFEENERSRILQLLNSCNSCNS